MALSAFTSSTIRISGWLIVFDVVHGIRCISTTQRATAATSDHSTSHHPTHFISGTFGGTFSTANPSKAYYALTITSLICFRLLGKNTF
ncbi:hypothetical protein JOM56_006866 [Amanita muscaria]